MASLLKPAPSSHLPSCFPGAAATAVADAAAATVEASGVKQAAQAVADVAAPAATTVATVAGDQCGVKQAALPKLLAEQSTA